VRPCIESALQVFADRKARGINTAHIDAAVMPERMAEIIPRA
jgi:hypothetical protein